MHTNYQIALAEAIVVRRRWISRLHLVDVLGCSKPQATKILGRLCDEQPSLMQYCVRTKCWQLNCLGERFKNQWQAQRYIDACVEVFHVDKTR